MQVNNQLTVNLCQVNDYFWKL